MRALGLRPRLLLLLGGLLVLALLPLQLALATYTMVTLRQLDEDRALSLGLMLSAEVQRATQLSAEQLVAELARGASEATLVAASVTRAGREASFGEARVLAAVRAAYTSPEGLPRLIRLGERRLWAVEAGAPEGTTLLAIDAERAAARGGALIGMFGLYTFLIAVTLLFVAYFALTRLIVQPLDALSQAAQNVTLGKRKLPLPGGSAVRELAELGDSLERMTDRLLAEEQSLRDKIAELERARAELASAQTQLVRSERLASVGRLAAGLAHEIGNPVAALMGLADLLLDGQLEPHEQRDFIQRMRTEIERVHRKLEDLLAFARPRRPGGAAPATSGDVEAAVHDTSALIVHQASMHDVELCIDVYPGLPRVTLATEQLSQVILNLILNARDALEARPGGRITVAARPDAGGVRVSVEDDGPGVPEGIAEHIFEPFFTTKDVGKGTGLGLSVCQGLVSAAGGSLNLDPGYQSGARFVIHLPAREDAPLPAAREGGAAGDAKT